MPPNLLGLDAWGDLACFSRPELKVERLSYPAPTPSAARGLFDAIYAKPKEFRWQVRRIELLAEPAFLSLRRNEVKDVLNLNAVFGWMSGKHEPEPIWADGDRDLLGSDEKGRTQRQTIALRDVQYRLWAEIRPWPGFETQQAAFEAQFRRRVEHGKCFYQPYFGVREFPAYFGPVGSRFGDRDPVCWRRDLGFMLYDVFDLSRPGGGHDAPAISMFHAQVERGVLGVPDYSSSEVHKPGDGGPR
jgi:CRISPR-associated protein Cas5d